MKQRFLQAALVLAMTGCASSVNGGGSSASGSVGITHDDALVYAADSDLDTVFVVDAASASATGQVKVGRQPEKVLVAPDDTIYVTNRLGRSVSVLRRGETTESARIAVAVEPVGLGLSSDGKTLYVVNAASLTDPSVGTLMAIDTATRTVKWELAVGHEPRGLALLSDERAAVTLYKDGDLKLVDLVHGRITRDSTGLFERLNASALGLPSNLPNNSTSPPSPSPFPGQSLGTSHATGLEAVLPSRDGQQLFTLSLLSSDTQLNTATQPDGTTSGGGYSGGSCGASAVAAPALLSFTAAGDPEVDDQTACAVGDTSVRPPTLLSAFRTPVQGPVALALDTTGSYLFVANRETNNVSVVGVSSTSAAGLGSQNIDVGAGPTGVAITHDNRHAWVFNAFDHSLSRLDATAGQVTQSRVVPLGRDVLSPDAAAGRRLFFSAVDARMNNPSTGISCATCHLEAREDGHVWNFSDGPRQTPSLSGRHLDDTAPYHWSGEFPDMLSFMSHTVQERMGGTGVDETMEKQVAAFIRTLPPPDNAAGEHLSADAVARGQAAFAKAECGTCHEGPALTNNTFADVGTFVTTGTVVDDRVKLARGLNTPSLLGLGRTGPYLHDGSAATLEARLQRDREKDLHGKTSRLTDAELADLAAWLQTL
jgi:YVTN family beta-propeller protein